MSPKPDCKATSFDRYRRRSAGLSLVEYMVAIGIGSIVIAAVLAFSLYTGRGFAGVMNYVELEGQSRVTLDKMIREIRQAGKLTGYTSNKVTFVDADGKTFIYDYSPSDRTLTYTKDGATTTLLNECDTLNFSIFQRNTTNGTYDQYPTTLEASNAKVIQVNWVCSRTITGSKINTECVQTAKIVIRNQ